MKNNVVKVSSENFNEIVMENDKPVLVDFYADWCGPCKMLSPLIDQIADEMVEKATVCKINVDEARDIAIEYNIVSIPTLMVFKDGEIIETMVGARPKDDIVSVIESV